MNQQFYTIMPSHVLVGPAIVDAILHGCTCTPLRHEPFCGDYPGALAEEDWTTEAPIVWDDVHKQRKSDNAWAQEAVETGGVLCWRNRGHRRNGDNVPHLCFVDVHFGMGTPGLSSGGGGGGEGMASV